MNQPLLFIYWIRMDFWQEHGLIFLFFATFFPRLAMLFGVTVSFGLLAWLGWLFAPHLTVAVLATHYYWQTNPILCMIAWFVAFAGTFGETKTFSVLPKITIGIHKVRVN